MTDFGFVVVPRSWAKEVTRSLARIEQALKIEGETMSEIDDELGALETAVEALSEDETRELADLQALKDAGQTLTPDQHARFDALLAKVQADTAAIDAADPPPAAEPVPADTTPVA